MTDLVDRLRKDADAWSDSDALMVCGALETARLEREAAEEIKRLRALLARIYRATTRNEECLTLEDVQTICRPFAKAEGDES